MTKLFVSLVAGSLLAMPAAARAQAAGAGAQDSAHHAMSKAERRKMREEKREERGEKSGKREGHPAIRAAIRSLDRAKAELEGASHDFGGHKAEAIKSVDEALKHLRLALDYDKK